MLLKRHTCVAGETVFILVHHFMNGLQTETVPYKHDSLGGDAIRQ